MGTKAGGTKAGAASVSRVALYVAVGAFVGLAFGLAVVGAFGLNRAVTGLAIALIVGTAITGGLLAWDTVLVDTDGITIRTLRGTRHLAWSQVTGCQFLVDVPDGGGRRWLLLVDFKPDAPALDPVTLVSMPPVKHQVRNPYEHRKREQIIEIYRFIEANHVAFDIAPVIAERLQKHWNIEPLRGT